MSDGITPPSIEDLLTDARSLIANEIGEPWATVPDLEDAIDARGLMTNYITELGNMVLHYRTSQDGTFLYPALSVWAFIRATPAQRAAAFIATMEAHS